MFSFAPDVITRFHLIDQHKIKLFHRDYIKKSCKEIVEETKSPPSVKRNPLSNSLALPTLEIVDFSRYHVERV